MAKNKTSQKWDKLKPQSQTKQERYRCGGSVTTGYTVLDGNEIVFQSADMWPAILRRNELNAPA